MKAWEIAPAGEGRALPAEAPAKDGAPIGLYLHFPFCKARCHYCAFYFVVGREEIRAEYVEMLTREMQTRARDPRFAGRPLHSIYMGGGTPSLLHPREIGRLIEAAASFFSWEKNLEIRL
jgi:coproporphyrinogen III oxidase-like Fe-S oxidoreductase